MTGNRLPSDAAARPFVRGIRGWPRSRAPKAPRRAPWFRTARMGVLDSVESGGRVPLDPATILLVTRHSCSESDDDDGTAAAVPGSAGSRRVGHDAAWSLLRDAAIGRNAVLLC